MKTIFCLFLILPLYIYIFFLYIIFILWHNFTVISGKLQYIYLLFFVQIVKIMELRPFKSIPGSDTFWDGSIPNP